MRLKHNFDLIQLFFNTLDINKTLSCHIQEMIRGRGPDDESGGRKDQVETVIEESMDGNYKETCLTSEFNTSPTTIFLRQNLLTGQPASAGLPHLSGSNVQDVAKDVF